MPWKGTDPAEWARRMKDQLRDTLREAVQEMGIEMSKGGTGNPGPGIIPVDSGNLANSALIKVGAPVATSDEDFKKVPANLSAAADLKLGDFVYLGWQAKYARRVNYGLVGTDGLGRTYNQSGRLFAEAIAAKWPKIVATSAARVRVRYGG